MLRRPVSKAKDTPNQKQQNHLNENGIIDDTSAKKKLKHNVWDRQCSHRGKSRVYLLLLLFSCVLFVVLLTSTISYDSHNLHQYNYPRMVALENQDLLTEVTVVTKEQQEVQKQETREIAGAEEEKREYQHTLVNILLEAMKRQKKNASSKNYRGAYRDPLWEGDCQPMHSWQEALFPSCNKIHEIEFLSQMSYWTSGGYNDVFNLIDWDHSEYIVKKLDYRTSYDDRNFDRVRRDALIMERLTHSPYVLDIYGHCGFTQIVEYGRGGNLNKPLFYRSGLTSHQKLHLATQVAQGLADIHNIDGDDISSISHGDFKPGQYINVDGIYKLNDFNLGRFISWDAKKQEPCTFKVGYNGDKFRAPEEYKYLPETSAIDVWALGSIIYHLLTGARVWKKVDREEVYKRLIDGETPPISDDIRNSTDPVDKILMKALDMCYVYEPKDRPKASAVVGYLKQEAEKLGVEWQAPFRLKKRHS